MIDLFENCHNRSVGRDRPKFKVWRSAGLMLTYRCTAACEFCYYHCSPDRGGLMPTDMAIAAWESLKALAGDRARVHLTGGEPFLHWDRMIEILDAAHRQGLGPVDMIETNGSWAAGEGLVLERLKILADLGLGRLKVSCDPFHQAFVPIEQVRCLVENAEQVLGQDRVLVRWREYLDQPDSGPEAQLRSLQRHPCRFTGRAALTLGHRVPPRLDQGFGPCVQAFLDAKGVHIDPYGNVFSGTCSGIIIGTLFSRRLDEIWRSFDPDQGLLGRLIRMGPKGLIEEARALDYRPLGAYADACHLCTHLRQFLFDLGQEQSLIGPADCYA